MNEEKEVEKHINEIKEWQDHQYDPGYWHNKIPPYLLRKNKNLGIFFLMLGLVWLVAALVSFEPDNYIGSIFTLAFALLFLFSGYSKFKD